MKKYLEDMLAEARHTMPGWAFEDLMKQGRDPIEHDHELAGGSHSHVLDRRQKTTANDGEHYHLFLMPDGSVALSELGGAHRHALGDELDIEIEHTHEVNHGGVRYVTHSTLGHTHEAGVMSTSWGGMHQHHITINTGMQVTSLTPAAYYELILANRPADTLNPLVIHGPRESIAFISANPTTTDIARQESLTGPAGKVFKETYLKPLGMTRDDVILANIIPDHGKVTQQQLDKGVEHLRKFLAEKSPTVVVALGVPAKIALGELADFSLPHPRAVQKSPDEGWVARKIQLILQTHLERSKTKELASKSASFKISKADDERQVVYGVVIDPYQIDTQGDWVSPAVIEETAHDWFKDPKINLHHSSDTSSETRAVESWIVEYPSRVEYRAARANEPHRAFRRRFGADVIHSGAWIVGTKLDDELWAAFKRGEIASYSIEGFGSRRPISVGEMPEVFFVDQLARGDPGFD